MIDDEGHCLSVGVTKLCMAVARMTLIHTSLHVVEATSTANIAGSCDYEVALSGCARVVVHDDTEFRVRINMCWIRQRS